jgi:hypothetical protein
LRPSTESAGPPDTASRLHLDEYDRLASPRDEIYLGACGARVTGDDPVTAPTEMALSNLLAAPPEWSRRDESYDPVVEPRASGHGVLS